MSCFLQKQVNETFHLNCSGLWESKQKHFFDNFPLGLQLLPPIFNDRGTAFVLACSLNWLDWSGIGCDVHFDLESKQLLPISLTGCSSFLSELQLFENYHPTRDKHTTRFSLQSCFHVTILKISPRRVMQERDRERHKGLKDLLSDGPAESQ